MSKDSNKFSLSTLILSVTWAYFKLGIVTHKLFEGYKENSIEFLDWLLYYLYYLSTFI